MSSELDAPAVRPDGLQLDEKRGFQRRFWRLERLSWLLLSAFVLCALAGLAGGGGHFSRQTVAAGNATLDLPRITRAQGDDRIAILMQGGGTSRSIVLGDAFTRYFLIEQMQPAPERSRLVPSGFELVFAASGGGTTRVLMDLRPLRAGFASVGFSVDGMPGSAAVLVLP